MRISKVSVEMRVQLQPILVCVYPSVHVSSKINRSTLIILLLHRHLKKGAIYKKVFKMDKAAIQTFDSET